MQQYNSLKATLSDFRVTFYVARCFEQSLTILFAFLSYFYFVIPLDKNMSAVYKLIRSATFTNRLMKSLLNLRPRIYLNRAIIRRKRRRKKWRPTSTSADHRFSRNCRIYCQRTRGPHSVASCPFVPINRVPIISYIGTLFPTMLLNFVIKAAIRVGEVRASFVARNYVDKFIISDSLANRRRDTT